jgi:steroid 5-alpha reductase family enzyme
VSPGLLPHLLITLGVTAAVMAVTFGVAMRVGRHAVVDVAWGLGFAVVALAGYGLSQGHGSYPVRELVTALAVVWGVRLGVHIFLRSRGAGEDRRYARIMDRAPGSHAWYALRMIYLPQGVAMWFISLPVQVAQHARGPLPLLAIAGAVVWAAGFACEAVADAQLSRFRADPASSGKVLDHGLWRYSRHPNYFGDACVWWGLYLVACGTWPGVLTIASPLLMTWLLAQGTGKPLLERDLVKRRPEYAAYISRTSGFVPFPPRRV